MAQPFRDSQPGNCSCSQALVASDARGRRGARMDTTVSSGGHARRLARLRRKPRDCFGPMNSIQASSTSFNASIGHGFSASFGDFSGILCTPHLDFVGPLAAITPLNRRGCRVESFLNVPQYEDGDTEARRPVASGV